MNLVVDAGNSFVKAAIFKKDLLIQVGKFELKVWENKIDRLIGKNKIDKIIFSSVSLQHENINNKLNTIVPSLRMSNKLKLPIFIKYYSPETLGTDRVAGVVAAQKLYPKKNILTIDCGTCLTFNFLDKNQSFWGGSIAPGIKMRFKALNKFTKQLPLIEFENKIPNLIGMDTQSSILSGVLNGMKNEINGTIESYLNDYSSLKVILTGGDHSFFANTLKNKNFAHPNLVLIGLNEILEINY